MTRKQEATAKRAWKAYENRCAELQIDRNQHEGVAAFMIARALMKCTPGLKYYQAEHWALEWIARIS